MKANFISKRIVLIFTVLVLMGMGFNSCKKYEEGPSFTLLTATNRITGTWELKETSLNGAVININDIIGIFMGSMAADSTADMGFDLGNLSINGVKMKFDKDGTGSFIASVTVPVLGSYDMTESTTWKFDDKKDNVDIILMEETMSFEILRLTNKELWLSMSETINNETSTSIMKLEKEK
ncbi:MAG: hypothetical protein PHE33_05325 [Bacteroidales bacterium]|nr:hypothetical protein [Bacteroidales bacterium]